MGSDSASCRRIHVSGFPDQGERPTPAWVQQQAVVICEPNLNLRSERRINGQYVATNSTSRETPRILCRWYARDHDRKQFFRCVTGMPRRKRWSIAIVIAMSSSISRRQ